jgi:hypothetical protein
MNIRANKRPQMKYATTNVFRQFLEKKVEKEALKKIKEIDKSIARLNDELSRSQIGIILN